MSRNLFVALFWLTNSATWAMAEPPRPNVLFIAVDDLRPELGCYGKEHIHSPNIDRLAARGAVFERAYCMVPVCGASRASLMTGIRPTPTRFLTWTASAEKEAPGITTLNTHFKLHGYHTVSLGKVFNNPGDSSIGWSEPEWRPDGVWYGNPANQKIHEERQQKHPSLRGPSYESADVADDTFRDGILANRALEDLRRLARQPQPFFLAVGFIRPHLPFVAPSRYWDLYDRSAIQLPASYHATPTAPSEAIHTWGEMRAYVDVPSRGPVTEEHARALIHGYYACVSYIDAQIGKVLDELDRLQLADSTIIVLWGDHGWNLGEHALWCKHSCFETSLHVPLIVSVPGLKIGSQIRGLTEFIDIYPSLCELAGLPLAEHLEGQSFVPLLHEPDLPWKAAAISRYGSGDTIRVDQYRYTEYTEAGEVRAQMLYDHHIDPGEMLNLVPDPVHQQLADELAVELNAKNGKSMQRAAGRK